jgi:hypothetical protein
MSQFIVFVHGNADSENGVMPNEAQISAMTDFNERLVDAGAMLGGNGLHPTSKAVRVKYSADSTANFTDGPFTESKEIVSGYWLLQAKSIDEVKEWMSQAPFEEGDSLEIRQIFSAEDFGEALTPELQEREQAMRDKVEGQA